MLTRAAFTVRPGLGPSAATARSLSASPARRRAELAAEACRLDRRHAVLKAVASRCEPGHRGLDPHDAFALRLRVLRRAGALRIKFLRIIDSLIACGGFDEARVVLGGRGRPPTGRGP
jgi:hypothetical protein